MMARFRSFVQKMELKDLYLHGRIFTWSNEWEVPTLTRIARSLVSADWDFLNLDYVLQALSSSALDHAPLHLSLNASCMPKEVWT
jgi:hypothetical protein